MSALDELIEDDVARKRAFVALKKAIDRCFSVSDWREFAMEHDVPYIEGHGRLLRSLQFGDDDYGSSILQVLNYMGDHHEDALRILMRHDKLERKLKDDAPELYAAIHDDVAHIVVEDESLTASEVVRRALSDAKELIRSTGAISAVDRVHTALHGYLRDICDEESLSYPKDASAQQLYKVIRTNHPSFSAAGTHEEEIKRIGNSMAAALDAVNTLRNQASVAHPNADLLDEIDAKLAVNAARTLFNYVSGKISE
ncbi:abortive infection family protein [Janthinobacterium sp. NKUCC06_STL]|uniref:abortive infection family protein n=1 Tax=Janthinobacterium sp. NKUCC06_STL TaxID=2842127 RepID=UPI001C5AF2E3|nr:abortive infection family protein [Janthinobacterium sp. NKUCC06_STL]MBW3510610.1 abortive infection family protein [Janthinobacterium sp. NKUCC06_STL]